MGVMLVMATVIRHPILSAKAAIAGIRQGLSATRQSFPVEEEEASEPTIAPVQIIRAGTPQHPLRAYGFTE